MSPAKKSINLCMLMTKIAVRFKLDGACMLHRKYAASRGTESIKLGTMEPSRVPLRNMRVPWTIVVHRAQH